MNKMTKSLIVAFLALTMILAGCSNSGNNTVNDSSKLGKATNSKQAESALSKDEPAWKTVKDPVTLSWYTGVAGYSKKWDAQNTYIDKLITEETGVTVDFLHAGNDVN